MKKGRLPHAPPPKTFTAVQFFIGILLMRGEGRNHAFRQNTGAKLICSRAFHTLNALQGLVSRFLSPNDCKAALPTVKQSFKQSFEALIA